MLDSTAASVGEAVAQGDITGGECEVVIESVRRRKKGKMWKLDVLSLFFSGSSGGSPNETAGRGRIGRERGIEKNARKERKKKKVKLGEMIKTIKSGVGAVYK